MEFAKSILKANSLDRKGYMGIGVGTAHKFALVESACDDPDSEILICSQERNGLCQDVCPKPGVPYSAITPSMLPKELELNSGPGGIVVHSDDVNYYDELGFRIDEEDGPEQSSNKLLSIPFGEDTSASSHASDEVNELSWDSLPLKLPLTQKLWEMMRKNDKCEKTESSTSANSLNSSSDQTTQKFGGIPHSLRPQLWMRLSGALEKKFNSTSGGDTKPLSPSKRSSKNSENSDINLPYYKIVRESTANEYFSYAKSIEKDLLRILPGNGCFCKNDSPGISRLRRVLRSIAWLYPDVGYCQGMGTIVAHLLLLLEEEDTFWLLSTLIENILPSTYFSSDFIGIRVDTLVLSKLVAKYFPKVDSLLKEHDIDLGLIVFTWFLTIFASVVHVKILLRIWDLLFAEGDVLLFKVMLALFKYREAELIELKNSAEIFNFLSDLPSSLEDFDLLDIDFFENSLNKVNLEEERKKQSTLVPSDSSIFSNKYKKVKKRQLVGARERKNRANSVFKSFFGDLKGIEDVRNKNIRQTELIVDLHESILQIGRHFIAKDPKFMRVCLEPDFTPESHAKDHERFNFGIHNGLKRAKALVDFERRDDDELGFRKNDIITVINPKDEHCWIGELNGLRLVNLNLFFDQFFKVICIFSGWFPAKFVTGLDERSKQYSAAGDDSVSEDIADLVRGSLCPTLKKIFEHGMRKPSSLVGPIHPWMFLEEVANKEIERDFRSVYSRLVLCKTFRLDEDGKVLSPEELLYRSIEMVNRSHEKIQMDIKLRSLICLGLNEQVLHLWIEIICSSTEVLNKWYHPWSFLNSPGWVGLKCEARMLSQFSFSLSLDWELRALLAQKEDKFEVKSGVRDMLVKHHLFSWNL